MPLRSRIRKGLSLMSSPFFLKKFLNHRVAAASEHLEVIRFCEANTLFDIGANKGQFSIAFRRFRPSATIVAFEPLAEAADTYEEVFSKDRRVQLQRVALARQEGPAQFHVADRADSSSLLPPGEGQAEAFGIRSSRTIEVAVKRLDTCIDTASFAHPILVKVDVQGGELEVFQGCDSLNEIDFIYVELSFVELYEGQPLFDEVYEYLSDQGFSIAGIYNQVTTERFGPTQVDVLFRCIK